MNNYSKVNYKIHIDQERFAQINVSRWLNVEKHSKITQFSSLISKTSCEQSYFSLADKKLFLFIIFNLCLYEYFSMPLPLFHGH